MKNKKIDLLYYFGIIISLLTGFIGVYAQIKDPQTGLLLFLVLIGVIFLYFLLSWPIEYFQRRFKMIDFNLKNIDIIKKDLNILKDKLNFKSDVAKLDTRVSVIEELLKMKNKRGQIDPRLILIIIIIVIFILYLRSKGII